MVNWVNKYWYVVILISAMFVGGTIFFKNYCKEIQKEWTSKSNQIKKIQQKNAKNQLILDEKQQQVDYLNKKVEQYSSKIPNE